MGKRMSLCKCGQPVRVEWAKGDTPPVVTACEHCSPTKK